MAKSVNHAQIKRAAHNLSRQNTNNSFNPFAHIWSKQQQQQQQRRDTFPQDVERGGSSGRSTRDDDDYDEDGNGSPVNHVRTMPEMGSASLADGRHSGETKEFEKDTARENGDTAIGSQSSTADGVVKKRGTRKHGTVDEEHTDEPDESKDDKAKKGKDGKKGFSMYTPVHPKEPFTVGNQLKRTFLNSWINVLLIAAPVGIALHYAKVDPVAIFTVNFIAIIPLAAMLSFATEEIALRTGETLGGLLNATFGNAVELIVAVLALREGQVVIVQTSLIGSILSNLLLVLGMCFFFGGLHRQEQFFNTTVAQTAASLLSLAVGSVIVPTVFDAASITSVKDVAQLSRGTSLILLVVYAAYLYFQLKTHQVMFSEESKKVPSRRKEKKEKKKHRKGHHVEKGAVKQGMATPAGLMSAHGVSEREGNEHVSQNIQHGGPEEEGEEPQLHFFVAIGMLLGSTVIIGLCAEFLVESIDYVTTTGNISKEFLGLILLPIVGNAAEHATAVTVAIKDKMDLAIGVAVGSSIQVALFLIPLLVVIGWGMGDDKMSLSFDIFQVAVLFVAVVLVNYLIADGKSHWLEGMLLMCLYCIVAVCSWWYPTPETTETG